MKAFGTVRNSTLVDYFEIMLKTLEKLGRRQAVEILNYAVIVNYVKMRGRECDSKEEIVLFVAAVTGVLTGFFIADESRSGCTVMTVGDIE